MESLIPAYGLKFIERYTDYDPKLISAIIPNEDTFFLRYLSNRVRLIISRHQ